MSDDSVRWKDELAKVAQRLEAKTRQRRWSDRTAYLIERDFVLGTYAIRKLIDSHQLPERILQRRIPLRRFETNGAPPDPKAPADIAGRYDFENGRRTTLSIVDLCRETVNSFVFTICCGETADLFDGVYMSSDRDNCEHVYLILASDFIALCSDIVAA